MIDQTVRASDILTDEDGEPWPSAHNQERITANLEAQQQRADIKMLSNLLRERDVELAKLRLLNADLIRSIGLIAQKL